jgi:hypothetical protein
LAVVVQIPKINTKCCNKCKQYLDISLFSINAANKDKLSSKCKECDKEYQQKQRAKHYNYKREYSREYERKRRKDFNYRLQMLINASKQRAKQKGIEHTLTVEELKSIFPKDGICPILGIPLVFSTSGFSDNSPSVDKIDPSMGYTLDNVQVISWRANRLKSDATVEELEKVVAFLKQGE